MFTAARTIPPEHHFSPFHAHPCPFLVEVQQMLRPSRHVVTHPALPRFSVGDVTQSVRSDLPPFVQHGPNSRFAGQIRLVQRPLLLTQHRFAEAAHSSLRCSKSGQTGHSKLQITSHRLSVCCDRDQSSRRGTRDESCSKWETRHSSQLKPALKPDTHHSAVALTWAGVCPVQARNARWKALVSR